jgi:hypothetical protein
MRVRTNGFLLLAVAALGAFIMLVERKGEITRQREQEARRAVRVDPVRVSYLRIETTNGVIECAKENDEWMLVQPVRARASYAAMQRLLSALAELPKGEVITAEERKARNLTYASYGLTAPRVTITFGDALHRETLQIGRDAPLGGQLYIRALSGDHIVAVSSNLLTLLPASAMVLRDRVLIRVPPERVQRLEIATSAKLVQIARQSAGQWIIQQPVAGRASAPAIMQWLDALYHLTAADFITDAPGDLAPYGLDAPSLKANVWTGDKEPEIVLLLGSSVRDRPDMVYAKLAREPTVYAVRTNALPFMTLDIAAVRDKQLTPWQPREVASLEIRSGEGGLTLVRDQGEWRVTEPRPWKADGEKVDALLNAWIAAPILEFVDGVTNPAALGFDAPLWELTVFRSSPSAASPTGAMQSLRISIARPKEKSAEPLVRVENEAPLFRVAADALDALSVDPLFFRHREVLALASNDIVGVTVTAGERRQTLLRTEEGVFRPAEPQFVLNETGLQTLLMAARELRAERFVAEHPDSLSAYGLDRPTAQVTFELRNDLGISKTLLFGGPAGPSEVYAMLRGQDLVFTVQSAVQTALLPDLYRTPTP